MVIYEWKDYQYLGKVTSKTEEYLPVSIVLPSGRDTLICLASRRHTYVLPMLYEGVFAVHPTSVALFSTCQPGSQSRTPRFGPRESHSPRAKAVPVIRQANVFKHVKLLSAPTLVPPKPSHIMNRFNISSVKQDITASVCRYAICKAKILTTPSPSCRACHGTADPVDICVTEPAILRCSPIVSRHSSVS